MPRLIHDPVQALIDLLHPAAPQRVVVGLVGLPGAGKSTVAAQWTQAVNQRLQRPDAAPPMQCLGMDGFHLSRAQLQAMPNAAQALARRGAEWTFDPSDLRQHLKALRACDAQGQPVPCTWPGFDHGVGDPVADAIDVAPSSQLILVEGLYLLLPDAEWSLQALFDEVWFLDVSAEQAQNQLVQRHMRAWGWDETSARARAQASDALNAERVWATRDFADAWVAG